VVFTEPAGLEGMTQDPPARDQEWRPVVLVIDDDWEICEALQDVLTDAGYVGVCLTDASRGLDLLTRVEPRPDAILLDLMMPGMDGWRFVEEIRTAPSLKDIPIVVLTAAGPHWGYPVARILHKPVETQELLAALKDAVEGKIPDQIELLKQGPGGSIHPRGQFGR
jgi:CheY-like chemotaxis protein